MERAGLAPSSRVLAFAHEPADLKVAQALMVPVGEQVTRIARLHLANEHPIAYDITWLSLRLSALLSEEGLAHCLTKNLTC